MIRQNRRARIVRLTTLALICVGAVLLRSDAKADPPRETFGESAQLPNIGVGAGGSPGLLDVNETSGAPTSTFAFDLLRARGDVQPGLALHYAQGVDGDAGRGWTLGMPAVERKPLYGLPQYDRDPVGVASWPFPALTDRMSFNGMDLVPLCTITGGLCAAVLSASETFSSELEGWHYYRLLVDQTMQRFFWSPDLRTWRVEDPSGAVAEYGVPRFDSTYVNAIDFESSTSLGCDGGCAPYRWNLVDQWDSRGWNVNPIWYRWQKFVDADTSAPTRGYLTDILDTPPAARFPSTDLTTWAHHVRLDYEVQPFAVHSGHTLLFQWHDHRLSRVTVTSKDFANDAPRSEVRMYGLTYSDAAPSVASRLNSSYLTTVQPYAMSFLGTCVENGDLTMPPSCPARALPSQKFTYEGINDPLGSSDACNASTFLQAAQTIFQDSQPPSMLSGLPLQRATIADGTNDGLADLYLPGDDNLGKAAVSFTNQIPSTGQLIATTTSPDDVDGAYLLNPTMFNVVGDWGLDGASLLYGYDSAGVNVSDPADMAIAASVGYKLFRPKVVTAPSFKWSKALQNPTSACTQNNQCTSLTCDSGQCACAQDSDCPTGLSCQVSGQQGKHCVLTGGFFYGDINHDGLVDQVGPAQQALDGTTGGIRISTRNGQGRVVPFSTIMSNSYAPLPNETSDLLLDMDGDGLPDLAFNTCGLTNASTNTYTCFVYYYKGDGRGRFGPDPTNADQLVLQNFDPPEDGTTGAYSGLHDINGDGLPDLVVYGSTNAAVFLNRDGIGWLPAGSLRITPTGVGNRLAKAMYGDMDGDGLDDVVVLSRGDIDQTSTFDPDAITLLKAPRCGHLTTVTNGYGARASVYYDTLVNLEQRYGRSHGSIPAALTVVVGVDYYVPGGTPSLSSKSYFYDDPVYDQWQRRVRGFGSVRVRTGTNESYGSDIINGLSVAKHHTQRLTTYTVAQPDPKISGCSAATDSSCNPDVDEARQWPALPVRIDEFGDSSRAADLSNPYPFVASASSTYRSTTLPSYWHSTYATGLDGRPVRQLFRYSVDTYLYDTAPFVSQTKGVSHDVVCSPGTPNPGGPSTPICETISVSLPASNYAHLQRQGEYDAFGNLTVDIDKGLVDDNGAVMDPQDPPIRREYVPAQVGADWTWRRTDVTARGHGTIGHSTDYDRHVHYDWDTQGNLLDIQADLVGTVALERFHEPATPSKQVAADPYDKSVDRNAVTLATFTTTPYGNVETMSSPNGRCTRVAYDTPFGQLPTATTLYVSGPLCAGDALVTHQSFMREFAAVTSVLDNAGAVATMTPDDRGRITSMSQPDPANGMPGAPSVSVDYNNDNPQGLYHWVHVSGAGRERYVYLDASGQPAFALDHADTSAGDGAAWILGGIRGVDNDQNVLAYQPRWYNDGSPSAISTAPTPGAANSTTSLDEYSRVSVVKALDGTPVQALQYHALAIERTSEGNSHSSIDRNGHGRVSLTHQKVNGDNDDLQIAYQYSASGEPLQITQTHSANTNESVQRWVQFDSLGRMVANLEPNTTDIANGHYWRYAYNDNGNLVGTSDARGCGENLYYDYASRLYAEDYSPCLNSQEDYTQPDGATFNGTEAWYFYNSSNSWLLAAADRGGADFFLYDLRSRAVTQRRIVAQPGPTAFNVSDRYTVGQNDIDTTYDDANRVQTVSTGADVADLLGSNSLSTVTLNYTQRGLVGSVTSNYDGASGALLSGLTYEVDGLPNHIQFSDHAGTQRTTGYDVRRRPQTTQLTRPDPGSWATPASWTWNGGNGTYTPPSSSPPSTLQSDLEDVTLGYENGNLKTLSDNRVFPSTQWPTGAQPSSRTMTYDEARRMTSVQYAYPGSSDTQVPVFNSSELSALPALDVGSRVVSQTYQYDWRGNITQSSDDANGGRGAFFDRSLGTTTPDPTAQHQLKAAADADGSTLAAQYDVTGNLVNLVVQRQGTCAGPVLKCVQRFVYDWDEVGQLARARRWDYSTLPANDPPYPQVPTDPPSADVSFKYHQNQRILKDVANPGGQDTLTVTIFDSVRLDNTIYDAQAKDYVRDSRAESVYLAGVARVVYDASLPTRDGNPQHVLYQTGDQVGSTSTVFDRNTGELVERVTNQAYGATDSDYRSERWANYREPRRLSGNIDDTELGLVYFGARYYSPNLQRWISADPATIHGLRASFNPYAYLNGGPAQSVDIFGLGEDGGTDTGDNSSDGGTQPGGGGSGGVQNGGSQQAGGVTGPVNVACYDPRCMGTPPQRKETPLAGAPSADANTNNAAPQATIGQQSYYAMTGFMHGAINLAVVGSFQLAAMKSTSNLMLTLSASIQDPTTRFALQAVAGFVHDVSSGPQANAPVGVQQAWRYAGTAPGLLVDLLTFGAGIIETLPARGVPVVVSDAVAEGSASLIARETGQTFEVIDGVRRAKAAAELGQTTIEAEIQVGGKVVQTTQIPIDALRSPFKSAIDLSNPTMMQRWLRVLTGTRTGAPLPPIVVQPGTNGTTIAQIQFIF